MATTPCTIPTDPFALGFVPWSAQPEQQMLGKDKAKDDDDGDGDDGGDDDDDDDDDDDPDADKTPEEIKEELVRTRAALNRANGQGARQRKRRQTLQEQVDELREQLAKAPTSKKPAAKSKTAADDEEPRVDAEAIRQQEREKVERERDTDLKRSETKAALLAAGVTPANVKLLLPQVDLDELDVDPKTRDVDGIDAEMDRLRTEHGGLFSGKRPVSKRVAGQEDEKPKGGSSKGKSASERQAAALLGGR